MSDPMGRIWVEIGALRPLAPPIDVAKTYAALDKTGQITRMIRLPAGRALIGFDKSGRVYAMTAAAGIIKFGVYREP